MRHNQDRALNGLKSESTSAVEARYSAASNYPRKILDFKTAEERFMEELAA